MSQSQMCYLLMHLPHVAGGRRSKMSTTTSLRSSEAVLSDRSEHFSLHDLTVQVADVAFSQCYGCFPTSFFKTPAPYPLLQPADAALFSLNLAADLALLMLVLRSPDKLHATSFTSERCLRATLTHRTPFPVATREKCLIEIAHIDESAVGQAMGCGTML